MSHTMKKALMPLLLIFAAIVVLLAAMFFYEKKWGVEGPFENIHQHGSPAEELQEHGGVHDAHEH